jgi:hypothetical protein
LKDTAERIKAVDHAASMIEVILKYNKKLHDISAKAIVISSSMQLLFLVYIESCINIPYNSSDKIIICIWPLNS